ncbi:GNAT family N-acetyltransferase [Massilia sp. S19_KUP03_FR1]|uniref:GNAT family N-acetyltransferase n=1 Tax=Massilia sp. S19_KUP03_FR1 TaxID=3025503 RepID=UPI002FCCC525
MPSTSAFSIRPAAPTDIPALEALIARSAAGLGTGFYSPAQTAALSREVFGVDSQLVTDGTYFVMEVDGVTAACGGWSRRSTRFGADKMKTAPDRLLDPATEPAKIRAFFVDPAMARRGYGSALMRHCAAAAAAAGFGQLELVATMPGVPLYLAHGFALVERFDLTLQDGAVAAPMALMQRAL